MHVVLPFCPSLCFRAPWFGSNFVLTRSDLLHFRLSLVGTFCWRTVMSPHFFPRFSALEICPRTSFNSQRCQSCPSFQPQALKSGCCKLAKSTIPWFMYRIKPQQIPQKPSETSETTGAAQPRFENVRRPYNKHGVSVQKCICTYIYIYTHTHIHIYMSMYM